jgi:ASCH domain-containing protein
MRALTIRQPYAELIMRGEKRAEYRSWCTGYRGLLAIHAGLQFAEDTRVGNPDRLQRGGIVGVVTLYAIDGEDGDYRWLLDRPRRVAFVPCAGKQGLWRLTPRLQRLIE